MCNLFPAQTLPDQDARKAWLVVLASHRCSIYLEPSNWSLVFPMALCASHSAEKPKRTESKSLLLPNQNSQPGSTVLTFNSQFYLPTCSQSPHLTNSAGFPTLDSLLTWFKEAHSFLPIQIPGFTPSPVQCHRLCPVLPV